MPPQAVQIELERLGRRGMVVLPFIEPGQGRRRGAGTAAAWNG